MALGESITKDITLLWYQCPILNEGDGNPENNDLVSQITGDLTTIADLSHALIPSLLSSLEESIATRSTNGAGSSRDTQSQGEHNRQIASGGGNIMNPQHAQGLVSNYPLSNPAQQNCMGMGNAAPPFMSSAAPLFLGNATQSPWAMQPSIVKSRQPHISWATIARAMQPQPMIVQAMQPTGL